MANVRQKQGVTQIFSENDSKAYKSLTQQLKKELKDLFLEESLLKVNERTLIRWFNYPLSAPKKHHEKMHDCLIRIVKRQVKLIELDIATFKTSIKASESKKKALNEFLKLNNVA